MIDNVFEQQAETDSDEEMNMEDEIMDDMDEEDDDEDSEDDDTDDATDDDDDGDSDDEEIEVSCVNCYLYYCLRKILFVLNTQKPKRQIRLGHLDDFDSIAESQEDDDDEEEIPSDSEEESDDEDESQEGMEEEEGVDHDEEDFFDEVEADIQEYPDEFGVDDDMVRLANPRLFAHSSTRYASLLTMLFDFFAATASSSRKIRPKNPNPQLDHLPRNVSWRF